MLSIAFFSARRSASAFALGAATATILAFLVSLTGCAGVGTVEPTTPVTALGAMVGVVHGGQQPVTGSHVHLYEVGATGYGSASNNIITTGDGSDSGGNYVLTDSHGNFSLPAANYACTKPANQTYLLATGGNPGFADPSTNNTAITLIALLGKCGNISSLPDAVINEISTVAAVTAAQQFILDPIHIGSTAANKSGLVFASGLALDLVPVATGVASIANAAGTGVTPQQKVNTLGNVLAPCINSTGPASSDCTKLFTAVTPSGGTQPTDVASAMLLLAQNPGVNVTTLYGLPNAAAPFQPTLSTQPNDFALVIVYSGGGMTSPQNIAIDASGDAFVTNCPSCSGATGTDSIVGFSATGAVLTGTTGYTTSIHKPNGIAFDNAGNLWSTNLVSGSTVAQIVKQNGSTVAFAFNDATIKVPQGIALDTNNNAWITNQQSSTIVQVLAGGTRTMGPIQRTGFTAPQGIAIDGAGNIFAAGAGSSNILEVNSSGNFVMTITGSGLNQPIGVSIGSADNLFSINNGSSSVTVVNGGTGAGTFGYVGISDANLVAIDGFGTGWIADCASGCNSPYKGNLIHISSAPAPIAADDGSVGLQDPSLNFPVADAVDGSGNVWVTNSKAGTLTEYLGVAGPVLTPIAAASSTNALGTRP